MLDAQLPAQRFGSVDQRLRRSGVVRGRPAVDAERQRHQRVAEQPAFHFGERQHADDNAAALGDR